MPIEPKNVEQLVKAIKTLLEDKDLGIKMGKNGRKKIEEELIDIWSSEP